MTTQPTCEDRIEFKKGGRLEDISALLKLAAEDDLSEAERENAEGLGIDFEDDPREQAIERMDEYPLAVSTYRTWRIDLSTGGPADWLEVTTDSDGDVETIRYHFADWFDHAERTLEGDEFRYAADFANQVTGGFYVEQ